MASYEITDADSGKKITVALSQVAALEEDGITHGDRLNTDRRVVLQTGDSYNVSDDYATLKAALFP